MISLKKAGLEDREDGWRHGWPLSETRKKKILKLSRAMSERSGGNAIGMVEERSAIGAGVMGNPEEENPKVELNNVRKIREGLLMSKAELARRAKLSVLTIDRVEKGMACRMDTKRKIILSLGLKLTDRDKVFRT